jgi:hypothetical protein
MRILFYSIIFAAVICSCKKKSDTPTPAPTNTNNNNTTTPVDLRTGLNKKWVIGSSTSRIASAPSASDYVSFEFNAEGNYFIVKADKSLLTGTFTLNTADSIVTLFNTNSSTSQYATLSISDITTTQLIFKLTLNGSSTPIALNTTAVAPANPAPTSQAVNSTDSITKTWDMYQRVVGTTTTTLTGTGYYAHVTFTQSGTFWTETNTGQNSSIENSNGSWKWSDATQMQICTAAPDSTLNCNNPMRVAFDGQGNLILNYTLAGQGSVTEYYSPLKQ